MTANGSFKPEAVIPKQMKINYQVKYTIVTKELLVAAHGNK